MRECKRARKNVKEKGIGRKHAGMYAALSVPKVGKTDARGLGSVANTGFRNPPFRMCGNGRT